MTEQRPHFRSKNAIHPKVIIALAKEGLTQREREKIQYSNMPDTVFGRAALTCYDGVDTASSPSDNDNSVETVDLLAPDSEHV